MRLNYANFSRSWDYEHSLFSLFLNAKKTADFANFLITKVEDRKKKPKIMKGAAMSGRFFYCDMSFGHR